MERKEKNPSTAVNDLKGMLESRRGAWSKSERRFIREWIRPLGVQEDAIGNLWKQVGDSRVLWSCHTDTVHRQNGRQQVAWKDRKLALAPGSTSNCLGADDTAGCWLAREMIMHGVPGRYVFHRAEECGAVGSHWVAKHGQKNLDGIDYAIAFDRRGEDDIITHQSGMRTASDKFSKAFAAGLAMGYRASDGGSFTDTASYTDIVPECSNISVGYDCEHSKAESLDVPHILRLRRALINFDESTLVVDRKPGEIEYIDYGYSYGSAYGHNSGHRDEYASFDEFVADYYAKKRDYTACDTKPNRATLWRPRTSTTVQRAWEGSARDYHTGFKRDDEWTEGSWIEDVKVSSVVDICRNYPENVADVLEGLGYDANQLAKEAGLK